MLRLSKSPTFKVPKLQLSTNKTLSPLLESSTTSKISGLDSSLINSVSIRGKSKQKKLSPIEASSIVKTDILHRISKFRVKPEKTQTNRERSPDLSTQLIESITELKSLLIIKKNKLKLAQTKKEDVQKKIHDLRAKLQKENLFLGVCAAKLPPPSPAATVDSSCESKLSDVSCERTRILTKYIKEISANVEYENTKIGFMHKNTALEMNNTIMGESLKGLYFAVSQLSYNYLIDPLVQVKTIFKDNALSVTEANSLKLATLSMFKDTNFTIEKRNLAIKELQKELKTQIFKIITFLKEKDERTYRRIRYVGREIKKLEDKTQAIQAKHSQLKSLYSQDWQRLKMLMNHNGDNKRQNGEELCMSCGEYFIEALNDEESCVTHKSDWNGHCYWCCGKVEVDAPGCITTKHRRQIISQKYIKCGYSMCTSCKKYGHLRQECPSDPNVRSVEDMQSELKRVTSVFYAFYTKSFLIKNMKRFITRRSDMRRASMVISSDVPIGRRRRAHRAVSIA